MLLLDANYRDSYEVIYGSTLAILRCRLGILAIVRVAVLFAHHMDVCLLFLQVALEYLLKGPTASGDQVTAEVKSKLSDEHIKVG